MTLTSQFPSLTINHVQPVTAQLPDSGLQVENLLRFDGLADIYGIYRWISLNIKFPKT